MNLFLDTSSLIKLYHEEKDTPELDQKLSVIKINRIFLSEIAKIEFTSAIYKEARTKEISPDQASIIIESFTADYFKYTFIRTDENIIDQARSLCIKYGIDGLRTLDSIQLASCIAVRDQSVYFITADKLFEKLLFQEGLHVF